jgi:hypothetical protein
MNSFVPGLNGSNQGTIKRIDSQATADAADGDAPAVSRW